MPRHQAPQRYEAQPRNAWAFLVRAAAAVGLAVYPVLLGAVVLWPSPVDRPARGFLESTLADLYRQGLPLWVDYALLEWGANVALFLPLGLLMGLLLPRRWVWLAVLCGVAVSIGVETVQDAFLPQRYATVNDVLANSLGSAVGALLAYLLHPRRRRIRP